MDIWYLHAKSKPEDLKDELLEAQQIAKKAGKTRFVGVSTHAGQPELFPAVIQKMPHFDVILTSYNFTMDPKMDELIAAATKQGIGIVAMKVMAGGFRRAKPGDKQAEILKREGAMLAALKWVLKNKNVGTTIPSITDNEQLEENLKAMSVAFSDADQKILMAQLEHISPLYCRMCGSCYGPVPEGAAGVRRDPVRQLFGRLRAVPAGAREFPVAGAGDQGRALRRLRQLLGPLPQRRAGPRATADRAGALRMKTVVLVVSVLLFAGPAMAQVPACTAVPGWTQKGETRSFDADTLFEYMDGNAEGYNLYHFVAMKGITCESGDMTLNIDVSEFEDTEFAYGMFTSTRDPRLPTEKLGVNGQITPRKGSSPRTSTTSRSPRTRRGTIRQR